MYLTTTTIEATSLVIQVSQILLANHFSDHMAQKPGLAVRLYSAQPTFKPTSKNS